MLKSFIENVIGDKSALYLEKAFNKNAVPHYVLLAWISYVGKDGFNKAIPGIDDSLLKLNKIEGRYEGKVSIKNTSIEFKDKSILDVIAIIAICLDLDNNDFSFSTLSKAQSNDLLNLAHSFILGFNKKINNKVYQIVLEHPIKEKECDICGLDLISNNTFNGCACFNKTGVSFKNKMNNLIIELEKASWKKPEMEMLARMLKNPRQ
jgi:hypothetical protein